jgi:hypothetical protein
MDEITISLDQSEEEILTYEVSDEALENVAGGEKEKARNYTHAFCTGFVGCPG